ncbi:rod shape-determining protein MreC [Candidatus Vallotia tarda]|uniref:Cell shape-determining protein MreC n=1 Tax=Candidatus Vallotiella hemipterorum TaxID=1177213 RepID=A0A916JR02_9BURK|nr:rod shape-determining protein MreC [Candidatus Vallotia tarda]CAG7595215.1 Cell shape-determining protein MreC [Candidatus Vallotia tarda]
MEYSPPTLFRQGPSAHSRLLIFLGLSIALLVADARFQAFEVVRKVIGMGLYPIQCAALAPRDLIISSTNLFVTIHELRSANKILLDKNLQLSVRMSQTAQLLAENKHLRELLRLQQNLTIQTTPAEVRYDTRDPFTHKVIISAGRQQNVQIGAPVVNEKGVIGQVTRVFLLQSEVTLLTDKNQAVPVQILRTGVRSVIYGSPKGDMLDLRFVPTSTDVKIGDELVTNGLDGIYPPGLPVAKVIRVDKKTDTTFAKVVCNPLAPVRSACQLLVLRYDVYKLAHPTDIAIDTANKIIRQVRAKKFSQTIAGNNTVTLAAIPIRAMLTGGVCGT